MRLTSTRIISNNYYQHKDLGKSDLRITPKSNISEKSLYNSQLKFSGILGYIGLDNETFLRNAAAEGNLSRVKELLSQGADIDGTDYLSCEKMTALALAIKNNRIEVAEYLLSKGAKPNIGDERPLYIALKKGLPNLCISLLKHGAFPDHSFDEICQGRQYPPILVFKNNYLIEAIKRNHLDLLSELIKNKAILSGTISKHYSLLKNPLTVAVETGNVKAVEILVTYGAQIHERNCTVCFCKDCREKDMVVKRHNGETALEIAETLAEKEPNNSDRKRILEILQNPDLIIKNETVSETPPERLLLDCIEKVSPISSSIALTENINQLTESKTADYVADSLKRNIQSSKDAATILKNKLCILYSKEEESIAKEIWDSIAIKTFGAPIIVLAGLGGLHKVLGMEDLKVEITQQIIKPLIHAKPDCFSGLILTGPPGTGKTFLAYQIAEHLGYPIHVVNSSEILTNNDGEAFYGEASKRIDELFKKAIENAPSILFFDEIDSIGRRRSKTNTNSASIDTNQIIQNINELIKHNTKNPKKRVLMIGAANYLSHLDPALIRPGRVLHIEVPACDKSSKIKILQSQLQETHIDSNSNYSSILEAIAEDDINFPPSDLIDIFKRARNMVDEGETVTEYHIRKSWESVRKVRARVNQQVSEGDS
jgi:AAA+ superfamily predicted ATPase